MAVVPKATDEGGSEREPVALRLKVLLVEDSEDDALLLTRALRQGGFDPIVLRVETFGALSASLRQQDWDIVLSDHNLPGFSAEQALELVRARFPELPFVVVSGCIGEEAAVALMRAGAQDYVLKDNLAKLAPVVEREIGEHRTRVERQRVEAARREEQAIHEAILENAAEGIVTFHADGSIRSMNRCAEQMFGHSSERMVGRSILELVDPDRRSMCEELLAKVRDCREDRIALSGLEVTALRSDRSTFCAQANASGVRLESGWYLTLFLRDITEQKQAERRIREQVERLGALRRIDLAIHSSLNLNLMLSVIVDQVGNQLGADAVDVLLLDRTTRALTHASSRGIASPELRRGVCKLGEGAAGIAALRNEVVRWRADDGKALGSRERQLVAEGIRYGWVVPLASKGEVLGVLEAFFRQEPDVPEDRLEFFEVVASQATMAVQSAELFDRLVRTNAELQLAYDQTLVGWAQVVDLRDRETKGHSERVSMAAARLAQAYGVGDEELVPLRQGALLHDVGKLAVPDSILLKPGPLTDEEWVEMRKHPVYAYEWLSPIQFLEPALDIPYCHHEKWDGSGYPRGLAGEEIPLPARIFAVVDVWDALLSDRPYRRAWEPEAVRAYIAEQSGRHFDPDVVRCFLEIEPSLPRA